MLLLLLLQAAYMLDVCLQLHAATPGVVSPVTALVYCSSA